MGIPEGEESKQGIESLFEEIMTKNFPNLVKEKDMQVQEVQRVSNKMNPKRSVPRHIITKMVKLKDKERILKATREKQVVTYKGTPIRLSSDFSIEAFQARRDCHEIFKEIKIKDLQPRLLYSASLSFKIEGEIRSLPHNKKLKEFVNTKPVLQ